jgi:hypothetical protein
MAAIDDNFAYDWSHPSNRETYDDLRGWCQLSKRVGVWYYPNSYGFWLPLPLGNVERTVTDLKLMKAVGVDMHIWEHNVGVAWNVGFTELQSYVFARMMNDLSLDWKDLAEDFIDATYGAASAGFRKYWQEHEELRKTTKFESFPWNANRSCFCHLTPDRIVRWERDFDEMEKLVKDDPERLYAIQRVRVALDYAALLDYRNMKGAGFEITAEKLGERVLQIVERVVHNHCTPDCRNMGERFRRVLRGSVASAVLEGNVKPKPLPKEIFGAVKEDRIFVAVPKVDGTDYEPHAEAAFSVVAVCTNVTKNGRISLSASIEDAVAKTSQPLEKISIGEIPHRDKFNFFNLGRFVISENSVLRVGVGGTSDIRADIGRAWEYGSHNRATVWISLKFEGASYFPDDAGKPDRILCDRVVVVRE